MTQTSKQVNVSGILTYWDPADCDYAKLRESAKRLQLAKYLPPRPSLTAAARRILGAMFDCGQTYRISHLRGLRGYQVDNLTRKDAENNYLPVFRILFADEHGARLPDPGYRVTLSESSAIPDAESRFHEAMKDARDILGRYKASRFLALSLSSLWGLPLRDRGGVYWLPADRAAEWQTIIRAVADAAVSEFTSHTIELVHDAASIAAVVAAVKHEVAKDIAELDASLHDKATKATVMKARTSADGLQKRLAHYSSLFGDSFNELKERAGKVRMLAVKAALEVAAASSKGIL